MSVQWILLLVLQAQCLCAFTFLSFVRFFFFFSVSLCSFKKRVNCIVDSTVSSLYQNHLNPNYFSPCAFFIVFYFCKWFSVHAQIIMAKCFSVWKCEAKRKKKKKKNLFHFFEASDEKNTPVNTFVCADRYLQACVGACVYVCAHVC